MEIHKGELQLTFSNSYDKKEIGRFSLSKPYRVVFDFKNTHISKHIKRKKFKFVRIAQYKPNTVRIVIESAKPFICNAYRPLFSWKRYHIPLPHGGHSKNSAKGRTVKSVINSKNIHKHQLIVIDAGHGGHDTGAISAGKREKDVVLKIAKKLQRQLKKRGYPVYMTREKDRFLKLTQRTKIADKKGAVVFVSIHANSVAKKNRFKVHGIETFFLQNTKDAKSQRIAARENRAVLKGAGSSLSKRVIIDSVLNGPKVVESNKLAIAVQGRIMKNLRSRYKGVRDGGVRHAPFYVLVGASRPSILVEVGYISHPKERKRLFSPRYQELIAKGIAEGIDSYLYHRKKEIDF